MSDEKPEKINLLPDDPEGLSRILIQGLQGYADDNDGVIKYQEVEDLVKPYANCMVVVQELKERGELDDEKAAELIEAHQEDE